MIKHTIHYDIRNIRKAGFIAFADDLVRIMREYWHMKRALKRLRSKVLYFEHQEIWDELAEHVDIDFK